jgi:hypothetical protein
MKKPTAKKTAPRGTRGEIGQVRIVDDLLPSPEELVLNDELDASEYRLSDEQVAEIKRRMANPNPKYLTLEEFNAHFRDRLDERAVVEPPIVPPDED